MLAALLLPVSLLLSPTASLNSVSRSVCAARAGRVFAQLDYKDPAVAAEFATVKSISLEELEEQLAAFGIIAPPTMGDMQLRLMLVETRMRKAGTLPGAKKSDMEKPVSAAAEHSSSRLLSHTLTR